MEWATVVLVVASMIHSGVASEIVSTIHSGVVVCIALIIAHSIALGAGVVLIIIHSIVLTIIMVMVADTMDTLVIFTMLRQVLVA